MTTRAYDADTPRRFSGVDRLYGTGSSAALGALRVVVIGIGGVGSWAVEALVRTGVGQLVLADLDHVAESNINRQAHALETTLGQAKVDAMAQRVALINPQCRVTCFEDFVDATNIEAILDDAPSGVLDCCDQAHAKIAIAAACHRRAVRLVVAGAAGGRVDPTRIRCADLARSSGDPLLARLRAQLRKEHGFPRGHTELFGLDAVYSDEPIRRPQAACDGDGAAQALQGLSCAGYGSSVCVTAPFGFAMAAQLIRRMLDQ